MYRNIKSCTNKYIMSYSFICCVIFVWVLCMFGNVYEDLMNCNKYNSFSLLLHFKQEEMLAHYEMSAEHIIVSGTGSWLQMFVPILTAFSFIPILCDEHEAKIVRYEIMRSSKLKFNASRYISSVVIGAITVVIGYLLFCMTVMILFPGRADYSQDIVSFYYLIRGGYYEDISIAALIWQKLRDVFLYGLVWGSPAMFLTCIMNNKYIIMCIPFFIKYAMGQLSYRVIDYASADIYNRNERAAQISQYLNPDNILGLVYSEEKMVRGILIVSAVVWMVMFIGYMMIQSRRTDCGE